MRVLVAGGGGGGLLTALVLARAGHDVEVVEREVLGPADGDDTVEGAAARAFRPGAPQLVQPHVLLPLFRLLLREQLPDVLDALLASGAVEADEDAQRPAGLTVADGAVGAVADDRLTLVMTRRSTLDRVVRHAALAEPGITLREDTRVHGLVGEPGPVPRVRGVRTDAGDLLADVVVDATGRRTRIDRWLAELGGSATRVEEAGCGVAYYARHYRLTRRTDLPGPANNRVVMPLGEFTAGFWGADNDAMLLGVCPLAEDVRFKDLRDPQRFTAVLAGVPVLARWLEVLEPIGEVHAMGGLHNTLRRLVVDGRPVALDLHAVGDTVCTTNPTLARGLGMALRTALDLRDALAAHPDDPERRAQVLDDAVSAHVAPYYRDQAVVDAVRRDQVRARVFGLPAPEPATDPDRVSYAELAAAAQADPTLFSVVTELKGMLRAPDDVYADPDVIARVRG